MRPENQNRLLGILSEEGLFSILDELGEIYREVGLNRDADKQELGSAELKVADMMFETSDKIRNSIMPPDLMVD